MSPFSDTYYYILGLGKSGLSAFNYLKRQNKHIFAWDDNPSVRNLIPQTFIKSPENVSLENIEKIILSPGIPNEGPNAHPFLVVAKKKGIPITVDIELFFEHHPRHVIGITGTNGKSTTTSLLCHLLNHFGVPSVAVGNIGTSVLDVHDLGQETYFVLELSSYQLSLLKTPALSFGILLNISPDHLEYHGSMEAYIKAKSTLFALMDHDQKYQNIIGIDDSYTKTMYQNYPNLISISSESKEGSIYKEGERIVDTIRGKNLPIPSLMNLQGSHNAQNILACYGALQQILQCKFSDDIFIEGLLSFKSLPHRQEIIANSGGILFINDSKATNMNAAEKSLKAFNNIHWILGGKAKAGETPLSLSTLFSRVKHTYLVGSSIDAFATQLEGTLPYTKVHTIDLAINAAYKKARDGDVILLAPACASFDQFKNFEERGNVFKTCVETLLKATHE